MGVARSRAGLVGGLCGVATTLAISLASCGNDFDALFGDRTGEAGVDAPPPGSGEGVLDALDATADGGTRCAPVAPGSCRPTAGCDAGICRFGCTGCGCACTPYDCLRQDGITRCETECTEGTSCEVRCNTIGTCVHGCAGCSGVFACASGAKSCTVSCTAGAVCETTCAPAAPCDVTCAPGSACLVRCGTATACDVSCSSTPTDCGGGVKVCGRACP